MCPFVETQNGEEPSCYWGEKSCYTSEQDLPNDLTWFQILCQGFTSGAHVERVLQAVDNWKEIQEDFRMGKLIFWLADQPSSKCSINTDD